MTQQQPNSNSVLMLLICIKTTFLQFNSNLILVVINVDVNMNTLIICNSIVTALKWQRLEED